MPHNTSFLNPLQTSVLAWIADGCPPGVVKGYSHRITAKALEARGLITIDGRRQTWSAVITEGGRALLELKVVPPDQSTVEATAFLQSVLDAGGLVVTEDRRNGPADTLMLEVVLGAPNRPFGKKLARNSVGGWVSDTTEWYLAEHFPDFVERRDVPLVTSARNFHPVVATYRDDRDDQRVSKDHLQRAALILQSLAAEAERRGYGIALPSAVKLRPSGSRSTDVGGQLALIIGENVFGVAISEVPGKGGVRLPYQPNPRLPTWQRERKFTFVSTGRLELEITNWSSAQRRSRFKDARSVLVESSLADLIFEIEVRSLEADREHDEAARRAAEKQAQWQRAMVDGEAALHESHLSCSGSALRWTMPESELEETDAIALSVVVNPEAPTDLQSFAQQYWELTGVDVDSGDPQWRFKTTNLNFAPWSGTAHYAAAAGATATAEDYLCGTCDGPFTLTSRQALLQVIRGNATECRSCNEQVAQQAAKILSGEGLEKRTAKLAEKEKTEAAQQSRVQLETDRRAYIEARYLVEDDSEEYFLDKTSVFARVGVLSVISGTGDQGGMLVEVNLRDESIAPSFELSRDLFVAAWNARLLQIHPTTPTDSLEWEEGAAVDTGAIYTDKVRFFAGSSGSLPERLSNMVNAAHIRVSIDGMWSTERSELQSLARQVVAEEAARYLTSEVAAHNLPLLTDKNKEALKLVTERGASLFSLGHLYGFAWRAARDASSAYQRNQGMPGEKAITHGLRKYETYIQAALDNPASMKGPFNESTVVPLSAVTRLLFNDIFGLNPMTATPQDVGDALASPPDDELLALCDAGIPVRGELVDRIRTSRDQWTPGQFRTILARLEDWQPPLCAPHCAHERVGAVAVEVGRTFDRIVSLTDDETAAIMTAEATGVANSLRDGIRTGDALLAELVSRLGIDAVADDDVSYF